MRSIDLSSGAMTQGFVSRDTELSRLNEWLQKALAGETQVCFITGEAGSGKTTLIEEFTQRSLKLDPNLICTRGNCNAQTGISDPYLPFRAILRMLMGDRTNAITKNNSNRLDAVFKTSGRALVEVAPELVGTLIPGAAILVGLARMAAKEKGLLQGLEERAKASERSQPDIEQSQIFLQYTALLRELSKAYPLVIILDDLQWVDDASNALFFHLVRELKDSRIFFIGLYRPNDVSVGRNGNRHPLQSTLNETKRMYGDIWIDLDHSTQTEGRAFVDALIDSQPNRLSADFREQLFNRTRGHALFTTELLRAMQDRDDLVQDAEGHWQESAQLDWETLPARIEGIIEERIERLEDELRDILDLACVQGQDFIAEVVAKIQNIKKRDLIKKLSRDLERCHRLVEDVGEVRFGTTRLWTYTFSHALFQVYLYNNLEIPERQMYHAEVAETLEELYANKAETIAVQLAYHYTAAGEPEKAAIYLQLAGEQACKLSDFLAARNFFTQALATVEIDASEPNYSNQAQLLWWLGETYYHTGQHSDAENYYRQSIEIETQYKNQEITSQTLISLAKSLSQQQRIEEALDIAQNALSVTRRYGNQLHECRALLVLGVIHGQMDLHIERLNYYEEALKIAEKIEDDHTKTSCLNGMAVLHGNVFGDYLKDIKYLDKALKLSSKINHFAGMIVYLDNLASVQIRLGNYEKANSIIEEFLKIANRIGNIYYTSEAYESLGTISYNEGFLDKAIERWLKAIRIADEYERFQVQVRGRCRLVIAYLVRNQVGLALQIIREAQSLAQSCKYTTKTQVHSEMFLEGLVLLRMGQAKEASRVLEAAQDHATQVLYTKRWAYRYHRAFAQAGVALLAPSDRQREYIDKATEFFQEAVEMCGWAGVLSEALWVLRELQKADPEQLLNPIEDYLVEKREIAWNNRPLID